MPKDRMDDGYVDNDRDIINHMDEVYTESYTVNSALWREGAIDKRFKVGDQNLLSLLYGETGAYAQRKFYFNLIRRQTNMVCGYQRQHRKSIVISPSEYKDQQLANDYTDLSMWSEHREGFHETFSQAFEGAVDTGISLLHMYNDYSLDPVNGDLFCDNVSYNNFLIDPWFRKQDLTDCNYIWRRRWVSKDMAKRLLPGRADEIDKMRPDGLKDGKFPIQAEICAGQNNKLFTYDEFHYYDTREVDIVIDTKTGETVEWEENEDDAENELELTLSQQPWLAVKKIQKPTVRVSIVLGGRVMYDGPNLLGVDRYPFVPVLCYHEPDVQNYGSRIMGMIRNLRDAQFLYNRRRIIELDIMESTVNSGYKYKAGAVTDERVFRQTGQGALIAITEDHEMTDVERIDPPTLPASVMELSRSLAEDIMKISGVTEELLGSAVDDKAGILAMVRQGAALTTLQTIFDKLDYSQKLYGSLRLEAIRKNWSNGKIKKILGRDIAPNFRLTDTQKFDTVVEQGSYSTTQREVELRQLLHFRELGIEIPDESILRAATIQNKNELIDDLRKQQEQRQQEQQAMAEQQQQQSAEQRMLNFAKSQRDMAAARDLQASAAEKVTRMDEISSQAEENRTKSDLNLVEQMIKLEDMQLSQIKNSIELAELIKASEEPTMAEVLPFQLEA